MPDTTLSIKSESWKDCSLSLIPFLLLLLLFAFMIVKSNPKHLPNKGTV